MLDNIIEKVNRAPIYYIIMLSILSIALAILIALIKKLIPIIFKALGLILIYLVSLYYRLSGNIIIFFRAKKINIFVYILIFIEELFFIIPSLVNFIVGKIRKIAIDIRRKDLKTLRVLVPILLAFIFTLIDIKTNIISETSYGSVTSTWVDSIKGIFENQETASEIADTATEVEGDKDIKDTYLIPRGIKLFDYLDMELQDIGYNSFDQECRFDSEIRIYEEVEYGLFRNADEKTFYVENPMQYLGKEIIPLDVSVSSYLSYMNEDNLKEYPKGNLVDNDFKTCWIEGADGSGTNEAISFTFSGPTSIDTINVANGFQSSDRTYRRNERVHNIQLSVDGNIVNSYFLNYFKADDFGWINIINLESPINVESELTLLITSVDTDECVYTDTAISEISFYRTHK